MRRVISIDPGLNRVAYAIWDVETGKLVCAGLAEIDYEVGTERAEKWRMMGQLVDDELGLSSGLAEDTWLVVEVPQVYGGPRNEDPNDLIDLAGVLGSIIGRMNEGHVEWSPVPRDWKGQAPKRVTQQRVDERLGPDETITIEWPIKSLCHNVYDAIHLGIVYLEREGFREIPLPVRYPNKA